MVTRLCHWKDVVNSESREEPEVGRGNIDRSIKLGQGEAAAHGRHRNRFGHFG
jgi:hypothetical protein